MLPHPVASKKLHRFGDKNFRVGLATMHGWRPTMEGKCHPQLLSSTTTIDAHSVKLSLKNHPDTAFFGIFDGHGGSRASQYVSERLVGLIEELDDVFNQDELIRICIELDQQLLDSFDKNEANVGTTCKQFFCTLLLIPFFFSCASLSPKLSHILLNCLQVYLAL
jgi:hypothetical protein